MVNNRENGRDAKVKVGGCSRNLKGRKAHRRRLGRNYAYAVRVNVKASQKSGRGKSGIWKVRPAGVFGLGHGAVIHNKIGVGGR